MADLEPQNSFAALMEDARTLHGRGSFEAAQAKWQAAEVFAPNPLEEGRAVRGDAASASRLGDHRYAISRDEQALRLQERAIREHPEGTSWWEGSREKAQTLGELGRVMLVEVVEKEHNRVFPPHTARGEAISALIRFNLAGSEIRHAEKLANDGEPDQYRINLASRGAVAHGLYGDRERARKEAWAAFRLGWISESPKLPTAAKDMSRTDRLLSRARGVMRGAGSVAVSHLATPHETVRRRAALKIARSRYFGL